MWIITKYLNNKPQFSQFLDIRRCLSHLGPSFTYTLMQIPSHSLNCIKLFFSVDWCLHHIFSFSLHCFSCYSPSPGLRQHFRICACSKQSLLALNTTLSPGSGVHNSMCHQMSNSGVTCLQHKLWEYESKIFGASELLRLWRQNFSVHKKSS